MKYLVLLFPGLLFFIAGFGQHNLSGGIRTSALTYVYKLDAKQARDLQRSKLKKVSESYLHTLSDSFVTGTKLPSLAAGNYLLIYAAANRLVHRLRTVGNLNAHLLSDDRNLSVLLNTGQGKAVRNAVVRLNNKRLDFSEKLQAYGPVAHRRAKQVNVVSDNVFYTFPAVQSRPAYGRKLSFPKKVLSNLFQPDRNRYVRRHDFHHSTAYEQKFRSFMVVNKPKLKPGDTIRLKSFVQTSKGKPVARRLLLRLSDDSFTKDTILAVLSPYRPGGFQYQFVLTDSLDLDLDENYLLTLEEESSRKYDLRDYEGDDEDAYAAKRKVVARAGFAYEEYELKSINFSARSEGREHNRGEDLSIFLKATDENDLAVFDGRVQILVLPDVSPQTNYHAPEMFIADTLWNHSQPLENIGETKISIPDSIFPKANFSYHIQCLFLNSNNELQVKTLYKEFRDEKDILVFTPKNDSLRIEYKVSGKSVQKEATATSLHQGDTLATQQLMLPASIQINPNADNYEVVSGKIKKNYILSSQAGKVTCLTRRTKDSIAIQLVNPQRLPVWYTVFAGKKIVLRGLGDSLFYSARSQTRRHYFITLQYLIAGAIVREDYTIPFRDKLLKIDIDQPGSVYPGQTAEIKLQVSNAAGEPVSDADLTAYGFTKKFQQGAPTVPYLGKNYPLRKSPAKYQVIEANDMESKVMFNWQRWSREMSLDTIEYYKFLHPQPMYINCEAVPDSITQLAPFVVIKGELQPIHLLYIDEKPVFFSQAEQLQRYSFPVSPGKHSLRIRTLNRSINLDSVIIVKGMKTLLSVDGDSSAKHQNVQSVSPALSQYEASLLRRYMIVVEDNSRQSQAYIRQGTQFFQFPLKFSHGQNRTLIGPLSGASAEMNVRNQIKQAFQPEAGWLFSFQQGLIKQKQYEGVMQFPKKLSALVPEYDFRDLVLTESQLDSAWQDYLDTRANREDLFRNSSVNRIGNGRLRIGFPQPLAVPENFIRSILLFRHDNADFLRVYKGNSTDLGFLEPTAYRLLVLLKGGRYMIQDSISILPGGVNYFEIRNAKVLEPDSVSRNVSRIVESAAASGLMSAYEVDQIKESFQDKYLDVSAFTNTVTGLLLSAAGNPINGASVEISGTRSGALTDSRGKFTLQTPLKGRLIISAPGFETKEVVIQYGGDYRLVLNEYSGSLSDVVVVGYGSQKRQSSTGTATTVTRELQGSVPGVLVQIRGNASLSSPLIIVDGLPYNGQIESIDPNIIASTTVLDGTKAAAIYGASAAGGAILITTKKSTGEVIIAQAQAGSTLRNRFSDEAFWQPVLRTDKQGKASFRVTFPDDITSWRTFAIATARHRFTGFSEGLIKSFKVLSGNISLPQFTIANDSVQIIGKTLNYTTDSIKVKRSFFVNDKIQAEDMLSLRNSRIDSFMVTPQTGDSLKIKYIVEQPDGYMDGEERSIPVYQQGVLETKGMFAALRKDTSFTIVPGSDSAKISISATSSPLPVLYAEAESIRTYEFFCNEQLASKLKALLAERKIDIFLKHRFTKDKNIREIIGQLNQGRNSVNMWGWWPNAESSVWISRHAAEALIQAQKAGYPASINMQALTDYLVFNIESYKGYEYLSALFLLKEIGAKVDFKTYIDSAEKRTRYSSMATKLKLAELKQSLGMPVELDAFISKQQQTVFGNIYWGNYGYDMFDNAIQNTLSMYKLLRSAGGHPDLLEKIRGYLLEVRKSGNWRNTYESSLILETILPDLLDENAQVSNASLSIKGRSTITVSSFPFSTEMKGGEKLTVTKQGTMPVYFSAYEKFWNKEPSRLDGNFLVRSYFERNQQRLSFLKAGEPVNLKVDVQVVADGEYVMIEIPIPAGCSYQEKRQSGINNEVHREYFKNKVSIFCRGLTKGEYRFELSLLPRFTGVYTLNPAKAEMMYFPIFAGREGIRKVVIK